MQPLIILWTIAKETSLFRLPVSPAMAVATLLRNASMLSGRTMIICGEVAGLLNMVTSVGPAMILLRVWGLLSVRMGVPRGLSTLAGFLLMNGQKVLVTGALLSLGRTPLSYPISPHKPLLTDENPYKAFLTSEKPLITDKNTPTIRLDTVVTEPKRHVENIRNPILDSSPLVRGEKPLFCPLYALNLSENPREETGSVREEGISRRGPYCRCVLQAALNDLM